MYRRATILVLLLGLLLAPISVAHVGHDEHEGPDAGSGGTVAVAFTEREQRSPDLDGDLVVWQERSPNGDWDVYLRDMSIEDGLPELVAGTRLDETVPLIDDDLILYRAAGSTTHELRLYDRSRGSRDILDQLPHARSPYAVADGLVAWASSNGTIQTYDAFERTLLHEFDAIPRGVAVQGDLVAWIQVAGNQWTVKVADARNGTTLFTQEGKGLMNRVNSLGFTGPIVGWLVPDASRALHLLDTDTGTFRQVKARTGGVGDLRGCEEGLIWEQASAVTSTRGMAMWTRDVDATGIYSVGAVDLSEPSCDKPWSAGTAPRGGVQQVFLVPTNQMRPPTIPTVTMDRTLWGEIVSGVANASGWAEPGDPEFPIQAVHLTLDGRGPIPADGYERFENGTVRWWIEFGTTDLLNGIHTLEVKAYTERSSASRGFGFYVDNEDTFLANEVIATNAFVEPAPSRASGLAALAEHYLRYQRFYNTVLLVILIVAYLVFVTVRWYRNRPRGRPEHVSAHPAEPEEPERIVFRPPGS